MKWTKRETGDNHLLQIKNIVFNKDNNMNYTDAWFEKVDIFLALRGPILDALPEF